MPKIIKNPWRGTGLDLGVVMPIADASDVAGLLARCPAHEVTPLRSCSEIARRAGVEAVWIKDERERMGLGSFKALGAAHAIAREAAAAAPEGAALTAALAGQTFVAASAGNHGLSVAAGAGIFGARAVIYLAQTVPAAFAARLEAHGAEVVRAGADYAASMAAAEHAAEERGWRLLSDSSWEGYFELPLRVMEGYTQLAAEAVDQLEEAPTHILLQAGVGGLAAAVAAHARLAWGDGPEIIVVEPEVAPALIESIRAGRAVTTDGPVSCMGRLDCKAPSLIALAGLARDADRFVTMTEAEVEAGVAVLAEAGIGTTPSGGAGLAALLAGLETGPEARVLAIVSEGPEDG